MRYNTILGPRDPKAPGVAGRAYWRSLEERAVSADFRRWIENEFPSDIVESLQGPSRRELLKVMAASFALAGFSGCGRQPQERVTPRVHADEATLKTKPLYYATSLTLDGYGRGALVKSYLGRPIKIEGNPDHPASLGATDIFAQAALLEMYDPDRSQAVIHRGDIASGQLFSKALTARIKQADETNGAGLHLLTGPISSPTVRHQLDTIFQRWPEARWFVDAPIGRSRTRAGARMAFGRLLEPLLRIDHADVILSIEDDFLFASPGHARYAREFASRRAVDAAKYTDATMNRLYVVEHSPTVTGTNADHRLPAPPDQAQALLLLTASKLGVPLGDSLPDAASRRLDDRMQRWAATVASDLLRHRGRALVTVGESQSPSLHCLGHLLNAHLDSIGNTMEMISPVTFEGDERAGTLAELGESLNAKQVETLLTLGSNPAYSAPAELAFSHLLGKASWTAHLGLYRDETATCCDWHLPMSHELESWGDARAFDGTAGVIQPLIGALYQGRSPVQVLAMLTGNDAHPRDIIKNYWLRSASPDAEELWRESLRRGFIKNTAATPADVALRAGALSEAVDQLSRFTDAARPYSLHLAPDPSIWDGRFANNGWLQELPKPVTRLTWDNALLISPATANALHVENGQVVKLNDGARHVAAPVWITPGQARNCLTLSLGYGRTAAGNVGNGVGVNAYAMRTVDQPWSRMVTAEVTDERHLLASTQHHQLMENRDLLRTGTLAQYRSRPASVAHSEPTPALSLYPDRPQDGPQWGMAINLGACIGCNACVVACQAENNIPVVGSQQVRRGRAMHWIRVDHYFEGDAEMPAIHHQPVPCMHCENAPCEVVCPVGATTHSKDGLNEMTYNRCVGTRYCSNNCPYKVRRFNFLNYNRDQPPSIQLSHNPDVTVRARGVMEKCTYCVQRIREAQIDAQKENRSLRDGEIVTACQQVCPAQAIRFGDVSDPTSAVSVAKHHPLNYGLLVDLNTRPRTTYLAGLKNPNLDMAASRQGT